MAQMKWNPDQYHRFQSERFAPFEDLLDLVNVREGLRVADLGCGTGELTARLAEALPKSEVVGFDSSPAMLEKAAELEGPGLRFEQCSIEEFEGEWDLIFSHAAIHWVEDHNALVPRLFGQVAAGGQLAVQVPSNHKHTAYTLIHAVVSEDPFYEALDGWMRHAPVLEIDAYSSLLFAAGGENITAYEKVYAHVLERADDLAEWTKGTALLPYLERLPGELHQPFYDRYVKLLRDLWPAGPIFYPFRRTLFSASRP
jgi:trans-aconitate 2-methyltransferase